MSKRPMLKPARSAPSNTAAISSAAAAKVGALARSSLTMPWISLASEGMRISGLMRHVRGARLFAGGGSIRTADSSTIRSDIGSVPVASMSKNTTGRESERHGQHRYRFADTGLDVTALRQQFADYQVRYQVAEEAL